MKFQTKNHVSGRTADGRVLSVMEGKASEVDDDDEGMVALVRGWAEAGAVELLDVEEEGGDSETAASGSEAAASEQADAGNGVDDELVQLRTEAEVLGVKVDGRWGADRLREEIAAVGKSTSSSSDGDE